MKAFILAAFAASLLGLGVMASKCTFNNTSGLVPPVVEVR